MTYLSLGLVIWKRIAFPYGSLSLLSRFLS